MFGCPIHIFYAITLSIQRLNTCDTFVCMVYFPSHSSVITNTVHKYILLFVVTPIQSLFSLSAPSSLCLSLIIESQTHHLLSSYPPPFLGSAEQQTDSEVGVQGERGRCVFV
jgi:hypothetical protein